MGRKAKHFRSSASKYMPAHFLISIRANACLKLSWVLETYQRGLIWEKDQSNNVAKKQQQQQLYL